VCVCVPRRHGNTEEDDVFPGDRLAQSPEPEREFGEPFAVGAQALNPKSSTFSLGGNFASSLRWVAEKIETTIIHLCTPQTLGVLLLYILDNTRLGP
jgi:hypothetical protein